MLNVIQAISSGYAGSLVEQLNTSGVWVPSSVQTDYSQGSHAPAEHTSYRTSYELLGGFTPEVGLGLLLNKRIDNAMRSLGWSDQFAAESRQWNVIKYTEGQHFGNHTDCWDETKGTGRSQRIATALLVLHQADEGGATEFPNLGLSVRPPAGTMLVWSNVIGGICSPLSLHSGSPVIRGTKIVAVRWFRGVDQ